VPISADSGSTPEPCNWAPASCRRRPLGVPRVDNYSVPADVGIMRCNTVSEYTTLDLSWKSSRKMEAGVAG
jgi:hypothetical protein